MDNTKMHTGFAYTPFAHGLGNRTGWHATAVAVTDADTAREHSAAIQRLADECASYALRRLTGANNG